MRLRKSIVEIFSTFLKLEADRVSEWVVSPGLRRRMESLIQKHPDTISVNHWALYWHQIWQEAPTSPAQDHLAAHLQETGYWVAYKMSLRFADRATLADFFQIAIVRLPKLLQRFNPQYNRSLQSFAEMVFKDSLVDWLRVQHKVEVCSDWALLYRISRRRLSYVLQAAGLGQTTIQQYIFAWECFREQVAIAPAEPNRLKALDTTTWEAITAAYNASRLSQVNPNAAVSRPAQVEQWLTQSAQLVRQFLQPQTIAADAPLPGQDSGRLLDALADETQVAPLELLLNEEEEIRRQQQLDQISQLLTGAIAELDEAAQSLLQAYYSQERTQTEIAQQLGLKQYQVSRQLERVRRSLLKKLAQWSQETLHITLTPDVVDAMSQTLEEWLWQTLQQLGDRQA